MTNVEMGQVTLSELEAMAERFSSAIRVIKEAQAMLGGHPQAVVHNIVSQWEIPPPQVAAKPVVQNISPEAQAELDAWKHSAARAKLLEQFKEPDQND